MKQLLFLCVLFVLALPGVASAQCGNAFYNRSSCYAAPAKTYYTYTPTYYPPSYYYAAPPYYGSTSDADKASLIAKAAALEVLQGLLSLEAIKGRGTMPAKEMPVPMQPTPQTLPPQQTQTPPQQPQQPYPFPTRARGPVRTEIDPKWQAAVTEACIRCHATTVAKVKGGGFDMSDLATVPYELRLETVQLMARHEMPPDKPLPEEKNSYIGLASDWAASARKLARKE